MRIEAQPPLARPPEARLDSILLPFGQKMSGSITNDKTVDRYFVFLPTPGEVKVNFTNDGVHTALPGKTASIRWLDTDGKTVGESRGAVDFPHTDSKKLAAGAWYFEVVGQGGVGRTGTYSLMLDYFVNEVKPNHTRTNAQPLASGMTVKGVIDARARNAVYRIDLPKPGRLSLYATRDGDGGLKDMNIAWLEAGGKQIRKDNNTGVYDRYMDMESGTYFIEITPWSDNHSGTYVLRPSFTEARNNEKRPNHSRANAQPIMVGQTVKGFISHQNRSGIYRVDLRQSGRLTVNASRDDSVGLRDMNIAWLNADGGQIRKDNNTGKYSRNVDLEAGTYFIEITPWSEVHSGTYDLRIDFTAARNNEERPNNSRANAQAVSSGQAVRGFISHQNRNGMYRVDLRQSGRLTVNASRDDNVGLKDMNVAWLNADGGQIRKDNNTGKYSRNVDLEAGTYFIEITPWSDAHSGTYNLQIEFADAARLEQEKRQKEEGERLAKTCPLCKKVFGYNYTVGNTHTVVDAQGRNVTKTTRTRVGRQYVNKTETQWCDGKRKSWR